ncbi:MAG: gliding motility-associated C-terminal domain-containing protein [Arcicella sp.]|nr:gliding motility-associated C-terminal domain-containing protein [Arcicella sp.]
MLKKIPHKNIILLIFFLIVSWASNAQTIAITKDGFGLCPGGSIGLATTDPTLRDYQWQIYRNAAQGWSAINSSSANSPKLTHDEAAIYRLLATDFSNNSRISNEVTVPLLVAPPIPVITPSRAVNQICQGDSLILSTNILPGYFYYWSFNDTQLAIPQSDKITAKKAGIYKLQITDNSATSNSCTAFSAPYKIDFTSVVPLKIDSLPPFCSITAAPVNIVATPAGGKFKGKGITNVDNGTFSPSVAGLGKHIITYTLADAGACPERTETRTFTVATPPATITTNTGRNQFCAGDIATLSAPAGMKKYEWFLNGSPAGSNSTLDVGAGGDFQVKVTDGEPCTNTSPTVKIEFFNPSSVKIAPIASGCGLEFPTVPLSASPSGGAFMIDGAFATTFDYKKLGFGKHTVTYTINGVLPCLQGSDTQVVEIQDFPKPNLGADIFLGKGNSITLKGLIDPTMNYSWSPIQDLDDPTSPNPVASPAQTQDYTLTVKTTLGCEGKDNVNIVVYQPIYIPTAFTPNNDSINDLWDLAGMEAYPNAEVQIFNRWGNIVFYSKGTYNFAPFDGSNNNKLLPEGMYVYKINPFPDRPDFQYKGTFMLLR